MASSLSSHHHHHHHPFSTLPSTPPTPHSSPPSLSLPIPIPKYPPKPLKTPLPPPKPKPQPPPPDPTRTVLLGPTGVSYLLPGAPFEFQYGYSETPKAKPSSLREPAFFPFAPPTMPRPWTGKAPLKKGKKKKIRLLGEAELAEGGKQLEMPGGIKGMMGRSGDGRSREEVLGEALTREEVEVLVKGAAGTNRQVNLGRDGFTHNMLELIHTHWKSRHVCKIKCKGVPTVDMDNVCRHLEEKTEGKVIHRVGGTVYLFRGRSYNYRTRPQYPKMLWKPAAPVYPKLIQDIPEGLMEEEAIELRRKGKFLLPILRLGKNGVYINLVKDVRQAFEGSSLVKIDCRGLKPSDYKKIGAKLMELVPCTLLSFDDEQILMFRRHDWKSMYSNRRRPSIFSPARTSPNDPNDPDSAESRDDAFSQRRDERSQAPE